MVRFNDKEQISALNDVDILPIYDVANSAEDDNKVTVGQLKSHITDGISLAPSFYPIGTCSTLPGDATKEVTITGLTELSDGQEIGVIFNYQNLYNGLFLAIDVNNTGDIPVRKMDGDSCNYKFPANSIIKFIYSNGAFYCKNDIVSSNFDELSSTWYKIFSDGTIEQGGVHPGDPGAPIAMSDTLYFTKEMLDTNYIEFFTSLSGALTPIVTEKDTEYMVVSWSNPPESSFTWKVIGYVESI